MFWGVSCVAQFAAESVACNTYPISLCLCELGMFSVSQSLQFLWILCQSWAAYQVPCWRLRGLSFRCVRRCTPSQWQKPAVCCRQHLSTCFITVILISMFRSAVNSLVLFSASFYACCSFPCSDLYQICQPYHDLSHSNKSKRQNVKICYSMADVHLFIFISSLLTQIIHLCWTIEQLKWSTSLAVFLASNWHSLLVASKQFFCVIMSLL